MLGYYYIGVYGEKIVGIGVLDYYMFSQDNNCFIGNIIIENVEIYQIYYGFENYNGMIFLGEGEWFFG